jgi:hypothetical protein
MTKSLVTCLILLVSCAIAKTQQPASVVNERNAALTESAIAFDSSGTAALEARLGSAALTGTAESPVTNVRIIVRNVSPISFAIVSGVVTFYDSTGVRCAEGVFSSQALAAGEQFETDVPGIRIRCSPVSWRLVATNLLPRYAPSTVTTTPVDSRGPKRLVISIDGEVHPIQLDKPMKLNLGNKERTIVVREEP